MDRTDTANSPPPKLDLDELMERIRSEVAERKRRMEESLPANRLTVSEISMKTPASALYARELLALPVAEFVRASHLALLGRDPQPDEFVHLRDRLLTGHAGRMRILRELRASKEGRARGSRVDGLTQAFVWDRIYWSPPAKLGRSLGHAAAELYRLPRRFRQFVARVETLERRAVEATATIKTIQSNRVADRQTATAQNSQIQNRIEQLRLRAEGINQAFVDRARTIEDSAAGTKAEIEAQLSGIETTLVDHWRGIVDQKLRIEAFLESATLIPGADRSPAAQIANEQTHLLDPLYLSFEDRYRGTRGEIKERQRPYLQLVEACARETGGAPVVDLGCGRGEWLELLSESGIAAWGCDLNRIAVEECRERGSTVQIGDALEVLKSTPDNSCSTVTGFHIIEHVSFEVLVSLLDHSLRVLRRGGAIILETPNPANLIVAAERFYYDPTHRNPLPSELMAYLLKSRGFQQVEVLPLHPVEWNSRKDYADPMLAYLQDKLFGPQDYGVVGRKIA